MPTKYVTSPGKKFGRLLATSAQYTKNHKALVDCVCDCGVAETIMQGQLWSGVRFECKTCGRKRSSAAVRTHGDYGSREYNSWIGLKCRAHTGSSHGDRYLHRGITVCRRWVKYENFLADMGRAPSGTSLDRKNNDRGYSKKNCRWATPTEQNNNTRANKRLTIGKETKTLAEWSRAFGLHTHAVYARYHKGERPPELFRPSSAVRLTVNGITDSLTGWGRKYDLKQATISYRYTKGERPPELFRPVR